MCHFARINYSVRKILELYLKRISMTSQHPFVKFRSAIAGPPRYGWFAVGPKHLIWIVALVLFPAVAQVNRGTLTGRVTDTAGGVLQGARVELQPGGAVTVSNNQGDFRFNDLAPGAYKLTVNFVGFAASTMDVNVSAGQPTRADATLQVANSTDSILVTADRPHGEAEAINRQRSSENILQVLPHDVIT